jgi:RNA polymerase sigma factor (sigma-70 family)
VTEADDLTQEALLRALSKHKNYDPARAFRPWLLTVTTNLCRDRLRTVWWRRVLPMSQPHCSSLPDPEQAMQATERDAQVRKSLAAIPLLYREALSLFYLDDMSYQEMSQITGSSLPALKQRVRRGRIMLREMMGELYPKAGL